MMASQGRPHYEISRRDAVSQKRCIHHSRTYELQSSKLVSLYDDKGEVHLGPPSVERRISIRRRVRVCIFARERKEKKDHEKSFIATAIPIQPVRQTRVGERGREREKSRENVPANVNALATAGQMSNSSVSRAWFARIMHPGEGGIHR